MSLPETCFFAKLRGCLLLPRIRILPVQIAKFTKFRVVSDLLILNRSERLPHFKIGDVVCCLRQIYILKITTLSAFARGENDSVNIRKDSRVSLFSWFCSKNFTAYGYRNSRTDFDIKNAKKKKLLEYPRYCRLAL